MTSNRLQLVATIVVLALAVAAGWAVMGAVQHTVSVVPGVEGCTRLEGSARQIRCLSQEFTSGAAAAARDSAAGSREDAVIGYVRAAERLAASDPKLAGLCHPAMHELGRSEGSRAADLDRVPTFPGGSSQLCTAGYVHGLAEGYLAGSARPDVAGVFPHLCHDAAARDGCAHGIGHALLRAHEEGRWLEATPQAIERCGELPASAADSCHAGVYMELAMLTQPKPVATADYARICNAADVEQKLSCWSYLGTSLATNDVPISEVPGWCAKASLPAQFPCIEGYGRDLGIKRLGDCAGASERVSLRKQCVDGAVGLPVGSGHATRSEARQACSGLDGTLRAHCNDAVDRYSRGREKVEGQPSAPS